ncbi:MAG: hypothetical protein JJ975_16395 [Bacteroidia bacterium]|nr:hypothetical protein [Bacteroidia bacterium]
MPKTANTLNHIKIQGDADFSTRWVNDFVRIAGHWESFAEKHNAQITGLITPYGFECAIKGVTDEFSCFELKARKKLQNVQAGMASKVSPYSTVLTFCAARDERSERGFVVRKSSIIRQVIAKIFGYRNGANSNELQVYYKPGEQPEVSNSDLNHLMGLTQLDKRGNTLKMKALSLPETDDDIRNWFDTLTRISR